MIKKLPIVFLMIAAVTFFTSEVAKACEIEFEVVSNKKEIYRAGDEIVVKVHVVFTHRVCPEGIESTKFKYEGMKIMGATKWEEISSGTFERKLKIKIEESSPDGLVLKAIRTCDKDGGIGSIKFIVADAAESNG